MDISHAPATGLGTALPLGSHDDVSCGQTRTGLRPATARKAIRRRRRRRPQPTSQRMDLNASSSLAMLTPVGCAPPRHACPGRRAVRGAAAARCRFAFHAPVLNGGGALNAPAQGPGFGARRCSGCCRSPVCRRCATPRCRTGCWRFAAAIARSPTAWRTCWPARTTPRFSPNDRAAVLRDMMQLHGTRSYREAEGGNRAQAMVEILGDVSAQSAAHPGSTAIRHTLDHLLQGRVALQPLLRRRRARPRVRLRLGPSPGRASSR